MENKENVQVMEGVPVTPSRQPLQEVGNIQSKSSTPSFMKRAQYSQVTPFFTPKARTPLRQKVQVPCAMRVLNEAADVPLNSLIYKKITGILNEKQKEHEDALEEKASEIKRLQYQLHVITLADQLPSESNTSANATVDCGCSPYPTPTPLFTNRSLIQNQSGASLGTSQGGNNLSPLSFKSKGQNKSLEFLPQLDTVSSLELAQGWSITKQLDYGSDEVFSTPNEHTKPTDSPQCGLVNDKTSSASTQITETNVILSSQGTDMTPTRSAHVETMVTPCQTTSVSVGTTPVSTHAGGMNTELVSGTDAETNTDTLQSSDIETNTEKIQSVDTETNTEIVQSKNIETNTEIIRSTDSQTTMTPVRRKDMSQCTSPASTQTKETCTTPIKSCQLIDSSVGTTAGRPYIPRPSEIDFGSLGVEDLALQLESAAISNTLLRTQVEALQQEKTSVLRQAAQTSGQVRQRDEELRRLEAEVVRREKLAKMSATTHVDELMEQQSQLLSQISNLKAELEKRNTKIAEAKTAHEQRVATIQGEMANLRKDLVTAYQHRKQQVEEIKAEYMATDYKPHYERARKELNLVQAQLAAFTGLGDEILKAQQLQDEAADLVSLRAREAEEKMELVTQHFKQHREWEKKHKEIEEQAAGQQLKVTSLEAETKQLKEQLTNREEEVNKLTEQIAKTLEQEKVHFVELESMRATLDLKSKEASTAAERLRVKTAEAAALVKELASLREALSAQTEAMSKLTQERNQYKKISEQQRFSLNTLRTGARQAEQLKRDLEALQAEHKVIKGDLRKQKRDLEMEIEFLTAEHDVHRAEDETSQQRMSELVEENAKLKEQSVLAADEIEGIRAQHHMVLEHKEAENTASVTAFDSLLEKVSLLRNRINFCKLQCTPDTEQAPQLGAVSSRRSEMPPIAEKSKRGGRKSFITSVLRAVSGVNSPTLPLPTIEDQEESAASEASDSLEAPALHVQMQDLAQTLEGLFSVVDELTDRVSDAMTLRAEVPRIQATLESQAATIERYKNQKVKLNYNWRTAEEELKNLEQIIETVREVLCIHELDIRKSWREANRLDRLGMLSTDNTATVE